MNLDAGGKGDPARDDHHGPSRAGHIPCAVCTEPISLDEYYTARCWVDPAGIPCAAHAPCLLRVGEREIGLR